DGGALEHRLGVRHRRVARKRKLVEVGDHRAVNARGHARIERRADDDHAGLRVELGRVQRRDVDGESPCELRERVGPRALAGAALPGGIPARIWPTALTAPGGGSSAAPMNAASMNGAIGSGCDATGPPTSTSVASGARSAARSGMPPRSRSVSTFV